MTTSPPHTNLQDKTEDMDITILGGIRDVESRYDAFIVDLWGVVHDGQKLYQGVKRCMEQIKYRGKKICLLSNSPSRLGGVVEKLAGYGINPDLYDHLVTSGEMTNLLLRDETFPLTQKLGRKFYDLWGDGYVGTLGGLKYEMVTDVRKADFVLASLIDKEGDRAASLLDFEDVLQLALERGLPMICANPDKVVNFGNEVHLCAGSVAERYAEMGGQVYWIGKPDRLIYDHCHALLGHMDKSRIAAVGDSLRTDIQGANNFGVDSIFNLIGIHWEEIRMDHQPLKPDLSRLREAILSQPHRPTYSITGFQWG